MSTKTNEAAVNQPEEAVTATTEVNETPTDHVASAEAAAVEEAVAQAAGDTAIAAAAEEEMLGEDDALAEDEPAEDEDGEADAEGDASEATADTENSADETPGAAPDDAADKEVPPQAEAPQPRRRRARRNSASPDTDQALAGVLERVEPVTVPTTRNAASAKTAAADRAYGSNRAMVHNDARARDEMRQSRQEERDTTLMAWGSLTNAMQRRQIINVMIATARILPDSSMVVASGMIEGFRVTIPYAAMFINPEAMDEKDDMIRAHRQRNILQKMIGCTVPVIITNMIRTPDGDYGIAASRVNALLRLRQINFDTEPARVQVGDTLTADIIAVGDHAVRASVAGFDLSIQTFQLTTRYLEYAHERYYTGQKLRVVIQNIRRNDEGKVIGIDVSGRLAEMEEMKRHIHRVALHETCFATITNIPNPKRNGNENSERPVVAHPWLYLDHFDLPARAMRVRTDAMTQPLKSGDNVLLYVTRIDEDHGIVIGDIVRRIGRKEATL